MKLGWPSCLVILACWSNAAAALTSAAPPDSIDRSEVDRSAGVPSIVVLPTAQPSPLQPNSGATGPSTAVRTGANPLWAIPLGVLSTTRDRPIFTPSRRPPTATAIPVAIPKFIPPPKTAEPERPQLSLVGTIARDDEKYGIFLEQASAAAVRLKIGEDYHGWKLRSVQGRVATLEKDEDVITLALPQPGEAPPTGLPPPLNFATPPLPGQLPSQSMPPPRRTRAGR